VARLCLVSVGISSALSATTSLLEIAADLLVSPELAGVLQNSELIGMDVGDALAQGRVPAPATLAPVGLELAGIGAIRRKKACA